MTDDLPEERQHDLTALEALSDDALWQVARTVMPQTEALELFALLAQSRKCELDPAEHQALAQLRQAADALTLSKAHAYTLLKRRGHCLPDLAELEAQA